MKKKHKDFIICVACIVLGLIIRCAFIIQYPVQPRDAYSYKSFICNWDKTGEMPNGSLGSLSLWIAKQLNNIFYDDIIKSGVVVNNLIGILLIYFTIKLMYTIKSGVYTSLFAGIVVATHPQLVRFSTAFLRENTYLLFTVVCIYFFFKYLKNGSCFRMIPVGFTIALCSLCRFEGMELLILCSIVAIARLFQKKRRLKETFVDITILHVSFAIFLVGIALFLDLRLINQEETLSKIKIKPLVEKNISIQRPKVNKQ